METITMGNLAFGAFCRAQAWAQENGTDKVPPEVLMAVAAEPSIWADVVKGGVATVDEDTGGITLQDVVKCPVKKARVPRATRTKTPFPSDWKPNNAHCKLAGECGLNLAQEAQGFMNHALAHDRRLANWNAGFTMWLSKANEYRGVASTKGRGYNMQEL